MILALILGFGSIGAAYFLGRIDGKRRGMTLATQEMARAGRNSREGGSR